MATEDWNDEVICNVCGECFYYLSTHTRWDDPHFSTCDECAHNSEFAGDSAPELWRYYVRASHSAATPSW